MEQEHIDNDGFPNAPRRTLAGRLTLGNDADDTAFIKKSYWKVSVQYLFLVLTTTVPRPLRAVPALYIIQAA